MKFKMITLEITAKDIGRVVMWGGFILVCCYFVYLLGISGARGYISESPEDYNTSLAYISRYAPDTIQTTPHGSVARWVFIEQIQYVLDGYRLLHPYVIFTTLMTIWGLIVTFILFRKINKTFSGKNGEK